MMRSSGFFNILLLLVLWVAPVVAGQSEQGTFEVRIKDHREAIDDFSRLLLSIDSVAISPKPGLRFWQTSWKEFSPSQASLDLTKYADKNSARIFRTDIDAGAFDAFHLKLKSIDGLLKINQRSAPVKNTLGPVKLSFDIAARGETVLVLDLTVVDFSDHPPRGYELSLKGYELYRNGKLVDKIPPG
ncbi:MAG TPA: DUF4382 domain-containing protein [Candidatus Polarisedimenticolaceae bacterium]|nr:DUF4382 domain-containing protein [Candidatus Polarisedimenticolaceae bacterium]